MEAAGVAQLTFGRRLAALPIVIVALLIGNAIGFVLATISGSDGLEQQGLQGALIVAAQAGVGAYLAFLGCRRFLKDHRYASAWLVAYVALIGLTILFAALSEFSGARTADAWQLPFLVVNAVAIEIARRTFMTLGDG